MKRTSLALAALLVLGCSANTTSSTGATNGTATALEPTAAGTPTSTAPVAKGNAPDFTLPTLDGANMSLSDHVGKVVLIDFWATTCNPCLEEMPHLVDMYEKYKSKGFIILAVSSDGPETRSAVNSVVHQKKMTFPVLMDEETTIIARYNPKKDMPFWVLVDKAGNIVKKKNGYDPGDEVKLAADIEALLK